MPFPRYVMPVDETRTSRGFYMREVSHEAEGRVERKIRRARSFPIDLSLPLWG